MEDDNVFEDVKTLPAWTEGKRNEMKSNEVSLLNFWNFMGKQKGR